MSRLSSILLNMPRLSSKLSQMCQNYHQYSRNMSRLLRLSQRIDTLIETSSACRDPVFWVSKPSCLSVISANLFDLSFLQIIFFVCLSFCLFVLLSVGCLTWVSFKSFLLSVCIFVCLSVWPEFPSNNFFRKNSLDYFVAIRLTVAAIKIKRKKDWKCCFNFGRFGLRVFVCFISFKRKVYAFIMPLAVVPGVARDF